MSKEAIFSLFNATSQTLTPVRILLIFMICLCGSAVIYVTYKLTSDTTTYNQAFNSINVLIALVTCVIMLMISSNIVISLGMVGALSIVRFRTAIKDARDTLFVFWSIVLGLCVGSQNFTLAGLSVFFIAAICFAFKIFPKFNRKFTLIIRAESTGLNINEVNEKLEKFDVAYRLDALNQNDASTEVVYTLKGKQCIEATQEIKSISGIKQANLINADE